MASQGQRVRAREWTLTLPYDKPPLSLNDRDIWQARHRKVGQLRNDTLILIRQARIPKLARLAVELHYAPRRKRRADKINLCATLKVLEDACVLAGLVPDDVERYVDSPMPTIHPPGPEFGQVYAVIRELPGE